MLIPWVTVWGFGADINARGQTLFVREKGKGEPRRYSFDEVSHILIAGDNVLHTSVISQCAKRNIPISFFDIHGTPLGMLAGDTKPRLSAVQAALPPHGFALSAIEAAYDSRMRFLHELESEIPGLFYQGEFDILTHARSEFEYLITLPELFRAHSLAKNMYYEILSRVVPKNLGYARRVEGGSQDPVNTLFSRGYAMLYATVAVACQGAGLNPDHGFLYEKKGACVYEIMEAAMTPMIDKAVIAVAREGLLDDCVISGGRCLISETAMEAFVKRVTQNINRSAIDENVLSFANCVENGGAVAYRYPM